MVFRYVTFSLSNSYVIKLSRYGTLTICDATLSDVYVVICYDCRSVALRDRRGTEESDYIKKELQ
jgi:hypothetical protein